MSVYTAERQINELTEVKGFYDRVREIVGFSTGEFWEDWEIKYLQRIADARYSEIGGNLQ